MIYVFFIYFARFYDKPSTILLARDNTLFLLMTFFSFMLLFLVFFSPPYIISVFSGRLLMLLKPNVLLTRDIPLLSLEFDV